MKAKQIAFLTFTLLILTCPVFAQTGKVAIVDTNAFMHPQKGITRLVKAIESAELELLPRQAELSELYERLRREREAFSFAGPIPTNPQPVTQEQREKLKEQGAATERSIKQKEAEMRLAHSRRVKEVSAPIVQDIRRSLVSFARSRGITLLLDADKAACLAGCEEESTAAVDVTQEFIAEYNRLNP
ncbi:MAG TPA: OmpH family outer membrane protein [Pyrinomonadaceae bacterium]|nr:OmpH family outer membrane protein [Pyrinomonadaceae bacterium]